MPCRGTRAGSAYDRGIARHAPGTGRQFCREMKAVDGVEEKEGANPFVEVFAAAAKGFQLGTSRHQFVHRRAVADRLKRPVAKSWIAGGDDFDEGAGHALG